MVRKIKNAIQKKLNNICYERHVAEIDAQDDAYKQWYRLNEEWKKHSYPVRGEDVVIFADRDGEVEEKAAGFIATYFEKHPYVQIAYADEDCIDEKGKRYQPWFKPQWSPDTLDSFQYFGHYFAVRKSLLSDVPEEEWKPCLTDCSGEACHRLLLKLTKKVTDRNWIKACEEHKAIVSIDKVLIHMYKEKEDAESVPSKAVLRENATVSVIIPSKDNPQVLETCISSLRKKTILDTGADARLSLEIIVVDNGSNEKNRAQIEKMAAKYDFSYHYSPMQFNFSVMCNLGVEKSCGEYILLLNDDMEVIQEDWLLKLLEKARLPHAGAVGAKLLYPNSDVIQHIGITNLTVGPAHKLLKLEDSSSYYHGQNRHIYDMIGVTAACLLVSREKYEEAGKLFEGMAVAYNDVDFCFTLHELGYYNILRNDVVLYHHESLSRGDDALSDEKWLRLLREKEILYSRHPFLKEFDPFYNRNLAGYSNLYLPNFRYRYELRDMGIKVRKWRGAIPEKWKNECLIVNTEHARAERKLELDGANEVYWIEGWSYVIGLDNCRYHRSLLLHGTNGNIYEAEVLIRYRKDVVAVLPGQKNVELAGFVCRIPEGVLPSDTYTIAMLAKDRCSKQRLYRKTDMCLIIK